MNDSINIKQQTAKGLFWSGIERFLVQGIQFVIQIIMARLLMPEAFGVVGMLAVFIAIGQSIIDSGFSQALIRKTDRTEVDFSTIFYFNVVIGILAYILLFFSAPWIADFYKTPILVDLAKVVGLSLLFNSLTVVQRAKMTINVDFRSQAKAIIPAVIVSGIVGIYLAYTGYGVWALAIQVVLNTFLNAIFLWIMTKWKPLWCFSIQSFRTLFAFGSKLLASGLLDTLYNNIYQLVIGKAFSSAALGDYTQANKIVSFPSAHLTAVLQRVTYPILCKIQDDDDRLREVYRKFLRLAAFLMFPLILGLAALAEPLIITLLGKQWNGAIILLQLLCLAMMWYPIHAINLNLLQVKGRSDLFLRLEIIKKAIAVVIIAISIPYGLIALVSSTIVMSIIGLVINMFYTGKLIQIGFVKQMKDLIPFFFLSLIMAFVIWITVSFISSDVLKLIVGIVEGVILYYVAARLFKMEELTYLLELVKKKSK